MSRPRFQIADCPSAQVRSLREQLGVSGALAQVLVRRGFGEVERARAFLAADEQHDASAFAGIEAAVTAILEHVSSGQRITVHGDYDVDGVCSTAILLRALRALGADADHYLPDRIGDGYGLSEETVQRLSARGTRLLITADCAITAVEQVALAQALGMQVVVTDHHTPRADGALPAAPIVHPAVCGYPCVELCATAVAYKLAQALFAASGRDVRELEQDLDLVALATIADVVPLLGENRTLVRRGLRTLAATAKPGLRALMSVARVNPARVDERAVGFALAPRLNAAGRLYRADAGLELILTEDKLRAAQVADELDRANYERREVELRIRYEAEAQIAALGERSGYVLAGEGWHAGVIGIVASRLAEQSNRPVVLIALDGERGRGSGRSIAAFDLLAGLDVCAEHLVRHGGHRAAAGLEVERERVDALAAAFDAHAARTLTADDLHALERVDAVVGGDELGMTLAEELTQLAPFGRGNPAVSLMLAEARFRDARSMGEGKHVRFTVESRGARARAVAFGNGGTLPVADGVLAEATFKLEVNEWNGVSEPRLVLRQAAPVQAPIEIHPLAAPRRDRLVAASAPTPASTAASPAQHPSGAAEEREQDEQLELALFAAP
ncbi:MAG TPA: single-stranded-DNA-specific exonuclease RecJ [Solirubrobacteraceae bacterium]|jgi:single-stranded-DNA-specific exonuclease|nr:single-stranded-DNA-specific exonuclease RecJ [Solirubrobacteraceae bacterium]